MKAPSVRDSQSSSLGTTRRSNSQANTANNSSSIGGQQGSQQNASNSSLSNQQGGNANSSSSNFAEHKTFVKVLHADNKVILLNSLCTCLHMLNYLKEQLKMNKDDLLDLIDLEGSLKEISNTNNKDYAIQFLNPSSNYVPLRIDIDPATNEKRYTPLLNEGKLSTSIIKTLTTLNAGKNLTARDRARLAREARNKAQQNNALAAGGQANAGNTNASGGSNATLSVNSTLNAAKGTISADAGAKRTGRAK